MSRPLFSISNHHVESCGEAPAVDGDAQGKYFGYFANEHGEQAVYTYDVDTREATLRMGDTGWQVVHPVVSGRVDGLILTETELGWLRACWMATGGTAGHSPRTSRSASRSASGSTSRPCRS